MRPWSRLAGYAAARSRGINWIWISENCFIGLHFFSLPHQSDPFVGGLLFFGNTVRGNRSFPFLRGLESAVYFLLNAERGFEVLTLKGGLIEFVKSDDRFPVLGFEIQV